MGSHSLRNFPNYLMVLDAKIIAYFQTPTDSMGELPRITDPTVELFIRRKVSAYSLKTGVMS
jgi:hypothetical protein